MAERLRQEETLQVIHSIVISFICFEIVISNFIFQALEAAVGGTWEGGQEFDLSSEGSLDEDDLSPVHSSKNPNKSGTRPRTLRNNTHVTKSAKINIFIVHKKRNRKSSIKSAKKQGW